MTTTRIYESTYDVTNYSDVTNTEQYVTDTSASVTNGTFTTSMTTQSAVSMTTNYDVIDAMTTTRIYESTYDMTNYSDVTNTEQYVTDTSASVTNGTFTTSMTTQSSVSMTTNYDVIDDDIFKTVTLAGSIAAIVIYFCVIGLLFGIGLRGIRSHIHCNVCFTLMTSHILLLVGADRESESTSCKIVSMVTQFSILVGLTWLMLEGIHLFHISMVGSDISTKKRKKRRKIRKKRKVDVNNQRRYRNMQNTRNREQHQANSVIEGEREGEDNAVEHQRNHRQTQTGNVEQNAPAEPQTKSSSCCGSRLLSYYIIGWIGPAMFIGATVPAALHGYGKSENCWLATENEIIWVFGAPVPAIFIFHCLATMLAISNYKAKIKQREDIQKANERAKLLVQRQREQQERIRAMRDKAAGGTPTPPLPRSNSRISHREALVRSKRNTLQRYPTIAQSSSEDESNSSSNNHTYRYVQLRNRYNETNYEDDTGYENNVIVHPPVYEVTQRTLAVSVPEDEANEPVSNYLAAVNWNLFLLPLVSATWSIGIIAINFRLVILIYLFCALNIFQAIYIFAFYCVVTFRMRQKWFVMTSEEINSDARSVTIWLGNNSDDESGVTNGRRTRKKIPNIELMMRTPTPFASAPLIEHQSEYSNDSIMNSNENIQYSNDIDFRRTKHNSVSKSVEVTPIRFQENGDLGLYSSLPNVASFDVRRSFKTFKKKNLVKRMNSTPTSSGISENKIKLTAATNDSNLTDSTIFESASTSLPSNGTTDSTKNIDLPGHSNFDSKILTTSLQDDINSLLKRESIPNGEEIDTEKQSILKGEHSVFPLQKSLSDKNMLKNPRRLRQLNSLPASSDTQRSHVQLNRLISNEPFQKSNSSTDLMNSVSFSTDTSSNKSVDIANITPPMAIEETSDIPSLTPPPFDATSQTILPKEEATNSSLRKTYNLDSDNNTASEPYKPTPRRQSHTFHLIPITPNKNEIPKIKSKNLRNSEKLKNLFKK